MATDAQIEQALSRAYRAAASWDASPVAHRAECLERAADLIEADTAFFGFVRA